MLPPKQDVYTTIEATIQHFKLVMEGAKVPAGECYSYTEGGNGELGFYLVSNGTGTPWRVRIRPPCFPITQGLSDTAALFGGKIIPWAAITGGTGIYRNAHGSSTVAVPVDVPNQTDADFVLYLR